MPMDHNKMDRCFDRHFEFGARADAAGVLVAATRLELAQRAVA